MLILSDVIRYLAVFIEYVGVFIVIWGAFVEISHFIKKGATSELRQDFAQKIMSGLEFIIAADIVLVTLASTREDLIQLGAVVLIRILLGYALKKEVT